MNKQLIRDIHEMPVPVVQMFAQICGHPTDDVGDLLEFEGLFLEEVIEKDVESNNIFLAFKVVEETLRVRWLKYLRVFSDASDV